MSACEPRPLSATRIASGGRCPGEFFSFRRVHLERAQIAAVDAVHLAIQGQRTVELGAVMHLAQHVKLKSPCSGAQMPQIRIGQRCNDQQDGVCTVRTRLNNLELIDDEILSQARQVGRCRRDLKVAQAALKERLVRQHG